MLSMLESTVVDLNDVHSGLNPCRVSEVARPETVRDLQRFVARAREERASISVAGARNAMGGQQFGAGTLHCDTSGLVRVVDFDAQGGLVEVEAGITWPILVATLHALQLTAATPWTIRQKQTGADRLTLGGAVSANIHGRGLRMKPFVDDIEAIALVDANGEVRRCSRDENADLFRLAVGGYGLFGILYSVTLRMARRQKMQRVVEIVTADAAMARFDERIRDGFTFGDFQFMTDERSPDFLSRGVMACYREAPMDTPIPAGQRDLTEDDWRALVHLAHSDKAQTYGRYTAHYMATSGQLYWSDTMQMSTYINDYHARIDAASGATARGSEMITEIYVPREVLARFLGIVAEDFRRAGVNLIYGTVRLIERDDETFLAWARENWACIVFNVHVEHTPAGIVHAADALRGLIDRAIAFGGNYYLTYHRFATYEQLVRCYPQFPEFARRKGALDPDGVFVSDWYRHYGRSSELHPPKSPFERGT